LFRVKLLATLLLVALPVGCGSGSDVTEQDTVPAAPPQKAAVETAPKAAAPTRSRPTNVLLITLDTTRADALGAYGQALPSSPNIDRLAREGVVFEQTIVSNPETLPSHASLFTGRFPFAHGVRSNSGYVLPDSSQTLAEILRTEGHATAAEISALVMNPQTQIAQGFEQVRDPDSPGVQHKRVRYGDGPEREVPTRVAADISRRGIEFLRRHRAEPFFLWLHYFDPHVPYSAPGRFNIRIPSSPYHAEVASADEEIGRVIDAVVELGLRDDTVVVLTSDHGEGLGEHGELTHSYFTYQSTMRVPLIFWGPKSFAQGARVESLVRNVDIAPTLLDLLGVEVPEPMQGVSLAPLLFGKSDGVDLLAYGESIELAKTFAVAPLRFVARGRFKYVHKVVPALYDLEADPGETTNVAAEHPEVVARLSAELAALLASGQGANAEAQTAVDAQTRARLEALGYVVGAPEGELEANIDDLEVSGIDAAEMIDDVETMGRIHALLGREDRVRALPLLEGLRTRHPQSTHLLTMHAGLMFDLARKDEAIALYRECIERDAHDLDSRQRLAHLLHEAGRVDDAVQLLLDVLELDQCADTVWSSLNDWLLASRRFVDRVDALGRAVAACPDSAATLNNLAWALATSPDAAARDGARAVEVAKRALDELGREDPAYLDTLAAAYAEAGDHGQAMRTEERAIEVLERAGAPAAAIEAFRATLEQLRAKKPVRDPAGNTNPPGAANGWNAAMIVIAGTIEIDPAQRRCFEVSRGLV
jgi:arylsulfatase A-like enzyme